MDERIKKTLEQWGVPLTEEQAARLELFNNELLEKNPRFNLVSRNDEGEIWPRHILDALAGVPLLRKLLGAGGSAADAGAGAGFPGIPLAVALEDLNFDLWDSSLKRSQFLTWTASRLKLKNVRALHRRIGQSGPLETGKYGAVVESLERLGTLRERVLVTGFAADEDLAALYSGAMMFVYPSRYEGFGLPVLEAMQCGVPVVTSDNSSLPEVVGEAGLMVPAEDGEALESAVLRLYEDEGLRRELAAKGLARAATFSWERTVDQTVAVYRRAVGRG